jgi:hypothetical protein
MLYCNNQYREATASSVSMQTATNNVTLYFTGQSCNTFLDLLVRLINLIFGRQGTPWCPRGSPPAGNPPSGGGAPPEGDFGRTPTVGTKAPPTDAEEIDPSQNESGRDWEWRNVLKMYLNQSTIKIKFVTSIHSKLHNHSHSLYEEKMGQINFKCVIIWSYRHASQPTGTLIKFWPMWESAYFTYGWLCVCVCVRECVYACIKAKRGTFAHFCHPREPRAAFVNESLFRNPGPPPHLVTSPSTACWTEGPPRPVNFWA